MVSSLLKPADTISGFTAETSMYSKRHGFFTTETSRYSKGMVSSLLKPAGTVKAWFLHY
jgi:hypothetical protein